MPVAYCVYDATPLPSLPFPSLPSPPLPADRAYLSIGLASTCGVLVFPPLSVFLDLGTRLVIFSSFCSIFHSRQFSLSLVLVSYTFPAPACVFSPIPWVLGLSISFHFIVPLPLRLPYFFQFWRQLYFFFPENTKVYQYRPGPHILGLSRRILTVHFFF